jgi:hypothetical protein
VLSAAAVKAAAECDISVRRLKFIENSQDKRRPIPNTMNAFTRGRNPLPHILHVELLASEHRCLDITRVLAALGPAIRYGS